MELENQNYFINNLEADDQENNSENSTPKRRRKEYFELIQFTDEAAWQTWLKTEDTWTKRMVRGDFAESLFRIEYFTCRFARRQANACPALLKVMTNKQTGEICVYQNQEHTQHLPQQGFSGQIKESMREKLAQKLKPAQIRDSILREQNSGPKMKQVQNWASYEKRISGLNASMSLEELRAYCESNSAEPQDENEPYIIGYKAETQKDLCIVWSSKKLIQLQHKSHTFSVDGTYKLMSLNWPILRCGFSDGRNRFHSTGIALARSENTDSYNFFFECISREREMPKWEPVYLMADGDAAITAAQKLCWPNTIRTNCFFHLMKNVREKMRSKPAAIYLEEVLSDIRILRKAGTYVEFMKAARVLNNHWAARFRNPELAQLCDVLDGFVAVYIRHEDNCGWFSGLAPESPTTNNGTESSNKQLKERDTMRRRLSIREFLQMAIQNIRVASLSPEHQNPIWPPPIPIQAFKEAYELEKQRRTIVEMRDAEDTILIPSKQGLVEFSGQGAHQMVIAYEHMHSPDEPFQSWAEYKIMRSKFHFIRRSTIWPTYYYCSCSEAAQRKPCKHSVFVMKMRGFVEYPLAITSEQLQPARKRGRPKNAKAGEALMNN